jgi:hypothetical protein
MTLIVTITGPETIWALADRRLSREGHVEREDARKLMVLETTDGVAILGYAGLGVTGLGTEPADWMSNVLRGRNWPLEPSLNALAEAIKRRLPAHLLRLRGPGPQVHTVCIPAFLGTKPRYYSIGLVAGSAGRPTFFRYTRWVVGKTGKSAPRTPRIAVDGSGAVHLFRDRRWERPLLRLIRSCDRGALQPDTVADHLAGLNSRVSRAERTVGPRCIVAWRHRKDGVHRGGGGHWCYTGSIRDPNSTLLPTIGCGMDVSAYISAMMPHVTGILTARLHGIPPPELDKCALDAALARLPADPDETLR